MDHQSEPVETSPIEQSATENQSPSPAAGFLPVAPPRRGVESVLVRLIATAGVIGIGTGLGAILGANDVTAWILALVVSTASVILSAVLWRSRRL